MRIYFDKQSCQISSQSDLKRRSLRLLEEVASARRRTRRTTRWV